jgi:hypothetical protein
MITEGRAQPAQENLPQDTERRIVPEVMQPVARMKRSRIRGATDKQTYERAPRISLHSIRATLAAILSFDDPAQAELGRRQTAIAIVVDGLKNFLFGVHHERPVLHDRLTERFAGNQDGFGRTG